MEYFGNFNGNMGIDPQKINNIQQQLSGMKIDDYHIQKVINLLKSLDFSGEAKIVAVLKQNSIPDEIIQVILDHEDIKTSGQFGPRYSFRQGQQIVPETASYAPIEGTASYVGPRYVQPQTPISSDTRGLYESGPYTNRPFVGGRRQLGGYSDNMPSYGSNAASFGGKRRSRRHKRKSHKKHRKSRRR